MFDGPVPTGSSRRQAIAWTALLVAVYAATFVCAAIPSAYGTAIALFVVAAVETLVDDRVRIVPWALGQASLTGPLRGLLCGLALILLTARSDDPVARTVVGVLALTLVHAATVALVRAVAYLRQPPALATGLPLDLPPVPPLPRTPTLTMATVPLTYAAAAVTLDLSNGVGPVVWALILVVAPAVLLARHALLLFRARLRTRLPAAIERAIEHLAPRTVVYYGDGPDWRYQLEVWLPTLERLSRPVLVLVRDHEVLRLLPPTSVPVVSVPTARTLLRMPMPSVRGSLFVGNNAHNLHLLRRPELRSAFIGHGDSDKGASANPFSRVYNEIWVAGPAGRDRYRAADVEIADAAFVEVGRPQLDPIPRVPDRVPLPTVLYAPTWEGWGETPNHSSVATTGPALIRALLARPGLRVMYRPHPRIGHLDAATRAGHEQVLALLRAAGAQSPSTGPARGTTVAGDALDRTLRPPAVAPPVRDDAAFWDARPGHRILTEPAPDVAACFAVTDLLVSDISSITSDFLAADRPYAIVNALDVPDEQFRASTSVAAGGFVLRPDLAGLDAVLDALTGVDPTAEARDRTRRHLVRDYGPAALAAFEAAVDRLPRS